MDVSQLVLVHPSHGKVIQQVGKEEIIMMPARTQPDPAGEGRGEQALENGAISKMAD